MNRLSYYIINAITMYRLASAPFLLLLAVSGGNVWFKWLVAFSFFTDAIDGPLSRRYNVTSVFEARLDSVADDATVLVSTIALWFLDPVFFLKNWVVMAGLFGLFAIQTIAALIAYGRVTSFHTYLAKVAAVVQAAFFIVFFFDFGPGQVLFTLAVWITAFQLMEELAIVIILPKWKSNIKGLYWVWRSRVQALNSK